MEVLPNPDIRVKDAKSKEKGEPERRRALEEEEGGGTEPEIARSKEAEERNGAEGEKIGGVGVKQIPTYLKDTTDALVLLDSMPFDKNAELITLDVKSLYTNIPQEATLGVICELLEANMSDSRTPPEFILDLAHLALTRNYFEFENQFYLQIQGTSMGSTFAPSLACLYVDNFERQVILHEENPYLEQIRLWKRYIDYILLIWTCSREEAHTFVAWLNTANPAKMRCVTYQLHWTLGTPFPRVQSAHPLRPDRRSQASGRSRPGTGYAGDLD
ncbi:hypothetical protein NDU88_004206 [Pleurodeles waltl]|uniref:Reverse transcriptase domain-containing protein n=1 Tax=Pleurodeles waltl TaxID=8319 RepID=A0AAV7MSZ8_PLEWA|nr:hypothetical protein NDU88_004206 [Pleurodeles waltl]